MGKQKVVLVDGSVVTYTPRKGNPWHGTVRAKNVHMSGFISSIDSRTGLRKFYAWTGKKNSTGFTFWDAPHHREVQAELAAAA